MQKEVVSFRLPDVLVFRLDSFVSGRAMRKRTHVLEKVLERFFADNSDGLISSFLETPDFIDAYRLEITKVRE